MPRFGTIIDAMKDAGIKFAAGLTSPEFATVEEYFGFRFPPDLRCFLHEVLPVGEKFPDWRDPESETLAKRMSWPLEGIQFDIEHAAFWMEEWGGRPELLEEAFAVAEMAIAEAPTLIPVFSHRYLPEEPQESGNPVFSVYQTDIIYYGADLHSYFNHEFGLNTSSVEAANIREIPFWSYLVEMNGAV